MNVCGEETFVSHSRIAIFHVLIVKENFAEASDGLASQGVK